MAFSNRNSTPRWTRSRIERPRLPTRLTEFDDNDASGTLTFHDISTSVQALEGRVPNYLLLVSLLEHLCSLYEGDPEKSQKIFNVLCQQLSKMKVMPSFSFLEEFSVIRAKYKMAFSDLMQAAVQEIGTEGMPWPPNLRKNSIPFSPYPRSVGKMNGLFSTGASRYKEEFVQLVRLGRGGFGSVFKVTNKLDGREYAVKKVPLKETDPDLCLKILREVKVLARLNHVNVVGYHSAWLEYVTIQNPKSALPRVSTHPVSLKELDDVSSLNGVYRIQEASHSNSIVFEHSSQSSGIRFAVGDNDDSLPIKRQHLAADGSRQRKIPSSANLKNSASTSRSSCAPYHHGQSAVRRSASSSNLGSLAGNENSDSAPSFHLAGNKTLGMMLFIQMQLCTTTLCDWLVSRNDKIRVTGETVDSAVNMAIFRQIVEGVRYIHSQALMHRDLKPRNLFLQSLTIREDQITPPLQVKIGDFGLARKDAVIYPDNSSSLASLIEPLTPLFPTFAGSSPGDAPTAGVGTCTYASPEQLRNNIYDNKADMYSLGIILFELFSPFGTEMERVTCIKNLRQGNLSIEFIQEWPVESELILQLVASNPEDRPSSEFVLKIDFVKDKSEVSKQLSEQLEMQTKQIDELKSVLLEKDLELEAQASDNERLQRELEERNEMIHRLLAARRLCSTCGKDMEIDME